MLDSDDDKKKGIDSFYDDELKSSKQRTEEHERERETQARADSYGYKLPDAQPKKRPNAFLAAIMAVTMVAVYFLGIVSYQLFNPDIMLLKKALDAVDSTYYLDVDKDELIDAALNGMLASLDPYSRFLSPEEYYYLVNPTPTDALSHGFRYYQRTPDFKWTIYSAAVGSGAYDAGLTMGDVILSVNGNDVYYYTTHEEFRSMIGHATLRFKVERDGEIIDITSTAAAYDSMFVEYYFGANNTNMPITQQEIAQVKQLDARSVGYIGFTDFARVTDEIDALTQFTEVMKEFKSVYGGKGKLVLNLKSNPGGNNYICYGMTGMLAYSKDGGTINAATIKTKNGMYPESNMVTSSYSGYFDINANYPQIVVLTDGNSASASEMLLSALLDYGTAVQVGTRTYGKGISQTVTTIKPAQIVVDNKLVTSYYAVYLTFAKIYSPLTDICIHGIGHIPSANNTFSKTSDQMTRANELLIRK